MKRILKKVYNKLNLTFFLTDFERSLLSSKKKVEGSIELFGQSFYYHHGKAFHDTYEEIFTTKIYDFD